MVQEGGRRLDAEIELLNPSITYMGGAIGFILHDKWDVGIIVFCYG